MKSEVKIWAMLLKQLFVCESKQGRDNLLIDILRVSDTVKVLSFLNVQAVVLAAKDNAFEVALNNSDYLLRDGLGVKIMCKSAGMKPGLNLHGTDLIPDLISCMDRNLSIAIMGTTEPSLVGAKKKLLSKGFEKVHTVDGFQSEGVYLDLAKKWKPDVVLLAMGMPKQEKISNMLKSEDLAAGTLIINGGAIVDYMSGTTKRAPQFICSMGLEWLYRLIRFPVKMWHRNFMTLLLMLKLPFAKKELRNYCTR